METIQGITYRRKTLKTLNVNVCFFYVFILYAANLNLNMQTHRPLIIMVWMQNPLAGLGDLLRGSIILHNLSQKLNFRFIVDTQFHPITNFLISNSHEYSDYVFQNKNSIINLVNTPNVIDTIKKILLHPDSIIKPILLTCNVMENITQNAHTVSFIRNFLNPTEEFKTQFNSMCSEFKITRNYSILHLRLGDDELVQNTINIEKYNQTLPIIDAHVHPNENILIIADSFAFKQYLRKVRPHLAHRIIPTKPIHLSHSTEKDTQMIKETLFDLFLLINSKTIKTYTIYGWVSGFAQWVSHVFNIPLIHINYKIQNMISEKTTNYRTPSIVLGHSRSTIANPINININMRMNPSVRMNPPQNSKLLLPTMIKFKLN